MYYKTGKSNESQSLTFLTTNNIIFRYLKKPLSLGVCVKMRIQMGCQLAIVKLSARNHAKIIKTLNFLVVRLSGFTVRLVLLIIMYMRFYVEKYGMRAKAHSQYNFFCDATRDLQQLRQENA